MGAVTDVNQVSQQIQQFWSPLFTKQLREQLLLGALVNKDYQGDIKQEGDTVYVSQINAPVGSLKTVGTDADTFDSELLSTSRVSIQANKRAVASFEFADLAILQSQIGSEDSEIREALLFAIEKQVNDYLYTLVNPSASSPDHLLTGTANLNAATLLSVRQLASQAKWLRDKGWWLLADPQYMNDILGAQTLTSRDYVGDEFPTIGGQVANKRFGFNILEDNSRTGGYALAFSPDFLNLVMQQMVRFKVSDLHSQKKFGYVISVDMVFGAALGIDGNKKHIKVTVA